MSKHLKIHIYGKCGVPCPGHTEEDCLEYLSNYYTFVLVFETHVCQHFVSPQLLRVLGLKKNSMVPVVFGGMNYNDLFASVVSEMEPDLIKNKNILTQNKVNQHFRKLNNVKISRPNILKDSNVFMIDALGQSPRALAHYLKHLAKVRSPDKLQSDHLQNYLKWKDYYQLSLRDWPCILCENLRKELFHKKSVPTFRKSSQESNHRSKFSELCTSWPKLDFGGGY